MTGSKYGMTKLWDMAEHSCIRTFTDSHTDEVTCIAMKVANYKLLCRCWIWGLLWEFDLQILLFKFWSWLMSLYNTILTNYFDHYSHFYCLLWMKLLKLWCIYRMDWLLLAVRMVLWGYLMQIVVIAFSKWLRWMSRIN